MRMEMHWTSVTMHLFREILNGNVMLFVKQKNKPKKKKKRNHSQTPSNSGWKKLTEDQMCMYICKIDVSGTFLTFIMFNITFKIPPKNINFHCSFNCPIYIVHACVSKQMSLDIMLLLLVFHSALMLHCAHAHTHTHTLFTICSVDYIHIDFLKAFPLDFAAQ